MSVTVCTYPIVGAVRKADDMLGPDRIWRPRNGMQMRFVHEYYTAADLLRIPELEAIASSSAAEINAWLAERKFDITLDPFRDDGFGTACMLDVLVSWLVTGDVRPLQLATRTEVPGVLLKDGVSFTESKRRGIIVSIETKNGDIVRLTREDTAPQGLDLADYVAVRASDSVVPNHDYAGVHFPMVDLDQQPDISWLIGMSTSDEQGDPWYIAQALQQTKFKMNQFGARVKSAAAIGLMRSSAQRPKSPLVIDGPFVIEVLRPGLKRPLLVAHITPEDMKDPGDLTNM